MISAELKNGQYFIRFKGKAKQFNEYINKVMSLPDRVYNFEDRCWTIPKVAVDVLEGLFKDIEFLEEVKPVKDTKPRNVSDYQDMGKHMLLQPYDYQKEAIKFGLDNDNILLVYPCGSGKTPIGIGLFLEALHNGKIKIPGMIVVKASLKTQWHKEVSKFSHLESVIIRTKADLTLNIKNRIKTRQANIKKLDKIRDKNKIANLRAEIIELQEDAENAFKKQFDGKDLFILNYEAVADEDIRAELHRRKIKFIFADEVHYIKSKDAQRSKALYEFKDAKMKIGATATPVGKDPQDLYGIFQFIKPELFPSFTKFEKTYINYAGYGRISGFKNLDHLTKTYAPYVIVKSKEDISDQLPSLLPMQRYCELTPEQYGMTQKIFDELDDLNQQDMALRARIFSKAQAENNPELMQIEGKIRALQTFAQELCDAPELLLNSESEFAQQYYVKCKTNPKLEMMADLVEEIISSGEKVCIFSRYERMQSIITERINKIKLKNPETEKSIPIKIAYVNGTIKDKQRYEEVYTKFSNDDDYKVLLMTDAGAEGLNLSKCQYIIEYDLAVSYAIQTQRHGRVERADSIHDTVYVYQLMCNDSWDEIAMKIIVKKEGYDFDLVKSLASNE